VFPQPAARPSVEPATQPSSSIAAADSPAPAPAVSEPTGANIPDTVPYPANELDIYPQALTRIAPDYPEAARDAHVAGSVTLLVLIDEAGKVVDTSVSDAVPDGVFEETAQAALANASFYPAQKDGRAVRSRILIKVEFDPESTGTAQ
jgi:protein TonB